MKDLGVIFDSELNFVAAQRELAQDVVKTYYYSMNLKTAHFSILTTTALRSSKFSGRTAVFTVFVWCDGGFTKTIFRNVEPNTFHVTLTDDHVY